MLNMGCGFYCLLAAHIGNFTSAAVMVLAGMLFDMLDGRVARFVHGESSFGVEFDSLSDFLTFGVAPAYMMYALFLKDYGIPGFLIVFIYALCGGLRLARFNAVAQSGSGSKSHFQGLPIPAAAGFLASFVLLYTIVEQARSAHTVAILTDTIPLVAPFVPLVMLALAFLMVSNVPYAAFKQADLLHPQNYRLLIAVAVVLGLLYYYPQNAVFLIFLFYVLSGFTSLFLRRRRED